jgi:hypothetical protein
LYIDSNNKNKNNEKKEWRISIDRWNKEIAINKFISTKLWIGFKLKQTIKIGIKNIEISVYKKIDEVEWDIEW